MHKKISKVLIANRGEIALRIIRACKEMGINNVCIFSEADLDGLWVRKADECYPIMGNPVQAYLDYEKIISLAIKSNCDAIHPGYGFLSESPEFAQACEDKGIIFIGPKPEHIALFGDKIASKNAMKKIGVPILGGTDEPITDLEKAKEVAREIGFPVIIKAAFGGGGRGMRIVEEEKDFEKLFQSASDESMKFFARNEMFVEKYIKNPRHIEVQIIADKFGNVIHLGERDCSIQRRHQKVIEIAQSPKLNKKVQRDIFRVATKAMFKLGYESVGTIEFLVDKDDNIYFIEMNTRVQVEHPVTELITGLDIIQRMIRIAEGSELKFMQEEVNFRGYAIEFRINAEDPNKGFAPSSGKIETYITPGGPGVRMDSSVYTGYTIPPYYDSMIAKLIVWALDWEGVVAKARRALDEFYLKGIPTNIALHRAVVRDPDFIEGKFDTGYFDKKLETFNLEAKHFFEEENEKLEKMQKFISTIKRNKLEVRH